MISRALLIRVVAAVTILLPLSSLSPLAGGELFKDDFSHYPPGWLSSPVGQLNGAIQEYHYCPESEIR